MTASEAHRRAVPASGGRHPQVTRPGGQPAAGGERDQQRTAVYAAQAQVARIMDRAPEFPIVEVAGSRLAVPVERRFGDLESVRGYVTAVLQLNWVRARWPNRARRPIAIRARRGVSRAHYEYAGATIALPDVRFGDRWAMRELVVLHELAHHLGGEADTGHGPGFAGRLVELVDGVIGAEAALLLRVAMLDQGVAIG